MQVLLNSIRELIKSYFLSSQGLTKWTPCPPVVSFEALLVCATRTAGLIKFRRGSKPASARESGNVEPFARGGGRPAGRADNQGVCL